jgi:hypothetical protein
MSSEFVDVDHPFLNECRWFGVLCGAFSGCVSHASPTRENALHLIHLSLSIRPVIASKQACCVTRSLLFSTLFYIGVPRPP